MRKRRLSKYKQNKLIKLFVADSTASAVVGEIKQLQATISIVYAY